MSLATGRGNTHPEVSPRQQYPLSHITHSCFPPRCNYSLTIIFCFSAGRDGKLFPGVIMSKCQFCFVKSVHSGSKLQPFFIPASNGFHFLPPVSEPALGCEGETPWFPDFLGLNFPIFQCQLSSNRRQEVCYNPFLLSHRSLSPTQIHKTFPIRLEI